MELQELDCEDCGRHVIGFGYQPESKLCISCEWIRTFVRPENQPDARRRLGVPLKRRLKAVDDPKS